MIDNPKRKNEEQSLWHKLADIFLLAKSFEYRVDESPALCAHQLRGLAQEKAETINPISREVKTIEINTQVYNFEIRVNRNRNGITYNTAKANGRILYDQALERTAIRGKLRLGTTTFLITHGVFLGAIVVMTRIPVSSTELPIFIAIFVAYYIFLLLRMASDYGKLHYLLHDTFTRSGEEKEKNHDE